MRRVSEETEWNQAGLELARLTWSPYAWLRYLCKAQNRTSSQPDMRLKTKVVYHRRFPCSSRSAPYEVRHHGRIISRYQWRTSSKLRGWFVWTTKRKTFWRGILHLPERTVALLLRCWAARLSQRRYCAQSLCIHGFIDLMIGITSNEMNFRTWLMIWSLSKYAPGLKEFGI